MKLELHQLERVGQPQASGQWSYQANQSASSEHQASDWVKLLNPPSAYSLDEALLLCQQSEDEWIAWVPDYGQLVLHSSQFIR